jgi:hypothetical protein
MRTLATLIDEHGVDVHEHLDRDELVPILTGLQFQGDVAVVPTDRPDPRGDVVAVPAAGIPVVRGENGGNTHLLLAGGPCTWNPVDRSGNGLDLGVLGVPAESTAWLAHPEHGYLGIGPGRYVIRRQREQADEVRLVAD